MSYSPEVVSLANLTEAAAAGVDLAQQDQGTQAYSDPTLSGFFPAEP